MVAGEWKKINMVKGRKLGFGVIDEDKQERNL